MTTIVRLCRAPPFIMLRLPLRIALRDRSQGRLLPARNLQYIARPRAPTPRLCTGLPPRRKGPKRPGLRKGPGRIPARTVRSCTGADEFQDVSSVS